MNTANALPLPAHVVLLDETVEKSGEWPVKLTVKDTQKNRTIGRFGRTREQAYARVIDAINERFDEDERGAL